MAHGSGLSIRVIENLQPLIDGGRYPIKRVVGEDLAVEAEFSRMDMTWWRPF